MASKYIIDNLSNIKSMNKLYFSIFLFFLSCIIQPILSFLKDTIFFKISENITYSLRENIFNFLLRSENNLLAEIKQGEITSRIVNDCEMFSNFITNFFVNYAKNILTIIIATLGMMYLSIKITITTILMTSLFIIIINYASKCFIKLSLIKQQSMDNLCININHALYSFDTIKSFALEDKIINDFRIANFKNKENNIKILMVHTIINSFSNALTLIILSFIYGYGAILVIRDEFTLGSLVALGVYFQFLIQPIFELINSQVSFKKIIPIINRINEFSMENNKIDILTNSETRKMFIKGKLDIENVTFKYNDNFVLNNISISIKEKEMIAIIGHSGSGKSTIINLILGIYKPSKGIIKLDDVDINHINIRMLRKNIGYIPQNIQLFNDSIKENIRCYDEKITMTMIVDICKKIGIHDFISGLDEGYNTIINEKTNISGGQKQLIAIARALVKKPIMLICDEPTSSLDPESTDKVMKVIYSLKNRYTVIIISHDVSSIKSVDNIFVIKNGEIVENGTPDLLIKNNSIYSKMISIQKHDDN